MSPSILSVFSANRAERARRACAPYGSHALSSPTANRSPAQIGNQLQAFAEGVRHQAFLAYGSIRIAALGVEPGTARASPLDRQIAEPTESISSRVTRSGVAEWIAAERRDCRAASTSMCRLGISPGRLNSRVLADPKTAVSPAPDPPPSQSERRCEPRRHRIVVFPDPFNIVGDFAGSPSRPSPRLRSSLVVVHPAVIRLPRQHSAIGGSGQCIGSLPKADLLRPYCQRGLAKQIETDAKTKSAT